MENNNSWKSDTSQTPLTLPEQWQTERLDLDNHLETDRGRQSERIKGKSSCDAKYWFMIQITLECEQELDGNGSVVVVVVGWNYGTLHQISSNFSLVKDVWSFVVAISCAFRAHTFYVDALFTALIFLSSMNVQTLVRSLQCIVGSFIFFTQQNEHFIGSETK